MGRVVAMFYLRAWQHNARGHIKDSKLQPEHFKHKSRKTNILYSINLSQAFIAGTAEGEGLVML